MKNIHVLPTDKSSRLHTYKGILNLAADEFVAPTIVKNDLINLNIYITSDEQIKEGDWYLNIEEKNGIKNPFYGKLYKANYSIKSVNTDYRHNLKKIILTTDQELIKDGVQSIDDEFLEWFVNNPSCEEVEVELKTKQLVKPYDVYNESVSFYKIIIPKEESKQENCCTPSGQIKRYVDCVGCDRKPKQEKLTYTESAKKEERISNCIMMKRKQETLEEAIKREYETRKFNSDFPFDPQSFKLGAKWQQEQQDNFVIGFLEYIEGTYSYSNIYDHWYLHSDTSKTYSKKELLKVYLKSKYYNEAYKKEK